MHQERTSYVIPVVLLCLAVVIGFAFIVSPGSASAGSDALTDSLLNGSVEGTVVLDDYFVIDQSSLSGNSFWGYNTQTPGDGNIDDGAYVNTELTNVALTGVAYSGGTGSKTAYVMGDSGFNGATGYLIDASGQRIDFTVSLVSSTGSTTRTYTYKLTPVDGGSTTVHYYRLGSNPIPTRYVDGWTNTNYPFIPTLTYGGYYLGIKELCIYPTAGVVQYRSSYGTYTYSSTIDNNQQQHLYCMEADDKYYFWLFRENLGSSLILEGKATVGIPAVTITNGGRYYTDNYFVSLDKYDTFGVEYGYSIQMSAFDSSSQIVTQTFTFGERGSTPGGSDDPIIIPPSVIEIPESLHSIIATPGELPSLNLPFDFTAPTFTLDLTSGFDTAFNSTWLGVNEAYSATKAGIDSFVANFAPQLSGLFADVVYTITTYVETFQTACEELKNTYAVPFFNLMVRISGLVPGIVWVVFDVWLIYCAVRLVVHIFTCPLADVIRRSF